MFKGIFSAVIVAIFAATQDVVRSQSSDMYVKCTTNDCTNKAGCVTIYQHRNLGGWFQCLSFQSNECITLNNWWIGSGPRVSSVNSHKTCVRLYDGTGCTGKSLQVEPTSGLIRNLKDRNFGDKAQSVSSCKRPLHQSRRADNKCSVDVLFSRNIPSEQVAESSGRILSVLNEVVGIAAKGFSEVVPGLEVLYDSVQFVAGLFNSEMSREALIDARIEESLARSSASQISAKIHVITNRLESIFSRQTPDADRRIALKLALHTCEEVQQLFEDRGYAFRQNKLVSSPYLVAFSSVYLPVARIIYEVRPELRERVTRDITELKELNERFMAEAVRQRKQRIVASGNWFTGYRLEDQICGSGVSRTQSGCRQTRPCKGQSDCQRCLESINSSVDDEIPRFFMPIIQKLEQFPN